MKNTKENDTVNWAKYYASEVIIQNPTSLRSILDAVLNKYNNADGHVASI